MKKNIHGLVGAVFALCAVVQAAEIPVVHTTDVVVVGGSSAAVSAAIAAKEAGADVFLIAPRPYLGEDLAGTLRVVRDPSDDTRSPIFRTFFAPAAAEDRNALAVRTTPFIVKRTLDKAMLAAGVPYLTGSLVCDVVKGADGAFAGVVMANRSGRQIVRAKVLIDATPRARAVRLTGGRTADFPAGTYTFNRVVISGDAPTGEGVKATALSEVFAVPVKNHLKPNFPTQIDARFWDCALTIPMKDGSARSFAEAEQIARDRTFVTTLVEAANTTTFFAPDHFTCRVSGGDWTGADALDLACLQPKGVDGVYVLGPLADLPRAAARQLMKPGACLMVGARVGRAAAETAKTRAAASGALVGVATGAPIPGTLGEHRGSLPSYIVNTKGMVTLPDSLPVLADCDTLVVGAGTGGGPAGIAAARHGARTLVCEYLYIEGGVQTAGLLGYYYFGNRVGFTTEIDDGTRAMGAVFPQAKGEWYRAEQRKAGAEIWFGAFANGVVVRDGHVVGAVVVLDDGTRGLVTCRNAIDATGNAELPAMAGEATEFITDDELSLQGVGQARMTLGADFTNSDIGFVDDTDAADIFYFALRSRFSLPENTWDQGQIVNSRERRRMIGAFYMSAQDVVLGRTYPDVITRTYSNFDTHGQTKDDQFFIHDPGHQPMYVNLPYRCLLPKKLEGLLVTGLGISAHRDAMPILRMQPDVQNQGYAAGTAAAMAVKGRTTVRAIDVKALQRHLFDKKILREEDLSMKDNFPLSDDAFDMAVAELADNYKGLPVLMTDRARALPRIRAAFFAAEGEAKVIYAHVLAMLGQPDGEQQLLAKFSAMDWDKGWNYRGMGQFNRSVSWVDSYAIALGHCKSKAAVPALIAKADQLTEKSGYSHFRSIARALEEIGDKQAIPALAAVLKRPGISGRWHVKDDDPPVIPGYRDRAGDWERTLALRELCIARALFRLGDTPDGLGRKTLEAYAADPRRAYANHAQKVLATSAHVVGDGSTGVDVETETLAVTVLGAGATIVITDKRTGRVWETEPVDKLFVSSVWKSGRALAIAFLDPETKREVTAFISTVPTKPEVLVTVIGDGDMAKFLNYPQPFKTRKGDRLIVPMNEGISFPVDAPDGMPGRLVTYGGHGVCMSFYGVQDDATGAGYMGIIETADDASVRFLRPDGNRTTATAGVSWESQKGRFAYARRIRFVFFDKGGYVAMCKRYRAYAKEQGKLKTFAEKVKERPLVDRLLGAPNIWCLSDDKIGMAKTIKAAGIDRFLWSSGGNPKQVAELAQMDGVLVSRYDVYRDIYRPEQLEKLGRKRHPGTNTDAWPGGAVWNSADSNDWRKAWSVKAKDGTWTSCACMCDAVSAKYCRKHVGDELKTHAYNTRFIDVTTAATWDTCNNPAHPMTRGESRGHRMDLLRLLGDEFGLVVGSETGHDAAVPYCDYFEGMLSLCHYRVPHAGRNLEQIWTNAPPRVAKFQVGAEYRLPLWELVYHDCLCAHWYWGDYNNKLPSLWDKRDLFNVLYGTMGMYLFYKKEWRDNQARFVRSYNITSPVARKTGYSEMLDHQILSKDRLVQRSIFADGTVVTVNFGDRAFVLPEGDTLAAGGHKVSMK